MIARLFLALLFLAGCSGAEPSNKAALELTGWVVDKAEVIDGDTERLLTDRLQSLNKQTGVQMVIVTTPSLGGQAIEDYSLKLANAWGIGHKDRNDGLVLLVAPNERNVRIEVGKGLETVMTNDICARIIARDMIPQFRLGQLQSAIVAGTDAIIQTMKNRQQQGRKAA